MSFVALGAAAMYRPAGQTTPLHARQAPASAAPYRALYVPAGQGVALTPLEQNAPGTHATHALS